MVKPVQQQFDWSYVFGALEITQGDGVFCYLPGVSLDHTQAHLEQIVKHDPKASMLSSGMEQAFHHQNGDLRVPQNIHLIQLPAYRPELNPIERLRDVMKDQICNRVFETLDSIEEKISETLKPYWEDSSYALKLVGDGWMHTQANATRT